MRRALLLAGLVCAAPPLAADPPAEDVLRPDLPSAGQFYIEPHAGINFTFLDGNPATRTLEVLEGPNDIFESGTGLDPRLGIVLGYNFDRTFGLRLDLAYDSRNAGNEGTTVDSCLITDFDTGAQTLSLQDVDKDFTIGVDYFAISALFSVSVDPVFFFAGPSIGIPLSRQVEEHWRIANPESGCRYFSGTSDSTINAVLVLRDDVEEAMRFSVKLGVGATFEIAERLFLVPTLGYDIGLTDLFEPHPVDDPDPTDPTRNPFDYRFRRGETLTAPTGIDIGTDFNEAIRMSSLQASIGLRIML